MIRNSPRKGDICASLLKYTMLSNLTVTIFFFTFVPINGGTESVLNETARPSANMMTSAVNLEDSTFNSEHLMNNTDRPVARSFITTSNPGAMNDSSQYGKYENYTHLAADDSEVIMYPEQLSNETISMVHLNVTHMPNMTEIFPYNTEAVTMYTESSRNITSKNLDNVTILDKNTSEHFMNESLYRDEMGHGTKPSKPIMMNTTEHIRKFIENKRNVTEPYSEVTMNMTRPTFTKSQNGMMNVTGAYHVPMSNATPPSITRTFQFMNTTTTYPESTLKITDLSNQAGRKNATTMFDRQGTVDDTVTLKPEILNKTQTSKSTPCLTSRTNTKGCVTGMMKSNLLLNLHFIHQCKQKVMEVSKAVI